MTIPEPYLAIILAAFLASAGAGCKFLFDIARHLDRLAAQLSHWTQIVQATVDTQRGHTVALTDLTGRVAVLPVNPAQPGEVYLRAMRGGR